MSETGHPVTTLRRHELDTLNAHQATARSDRSQLVLLEGPLGSGRTTLLSRFTRQCVDGITVSVSALPWTSDSPYDLAEQILDTLPLPGAPGEAGCPAHSPLMLAEAFAAADRPVTVVVDDAHWTDTESLRALVTAVRRAGCGRVLVLLAADDAASDLSPAFRKLRERHVDHTVPLGPLTSAEIRDLAHTAAGVHLSPGKARLLHEHTGGDLSSVLRIVAEATPEIWRDTSRSLPVPASVRAEVHEALQRCSPAGTAAARLVSVLHEPVRYEDVRDVLGVPDPLPGLDEAVRHGLLRVQDGTARTCFRFVSPMVRAAVYRSVPPAERRELHLRAAAGLKEPDPVLEHQAAAALGGDEELSAALRDRAGVHAAAGEWPTAARLFLTAAELTDGRDTRDALTIAGVDALVGSADIPAAMLHTPMLEEVRPCPSRDASLGYLDIHRGRRREAHASLHRAVAALDPATDPAGFASVAQRLVLHSLCEWRPEQLVHWAERVQETGEPGTSAVVEAWAIRTLGQAIVHGEGDGSRERLVAEIGSVSATHTQRFQMAAGWVALAMDDPVPARGLLESALPTREGDGSARISLWAEAWLARTHFVLGEWDEALRVVARASARFERYELTLLSPLLHWTAAQVHALRGDDAAAGNHLRRLDTSPEGYPIQVIPSAMCNIQCAAVRGDHEAVLRAARPLLELSESVDIHQPGFWPWHDMYSDALVLAGRVEEADAFLRPHEERSALAGHRSTTAKLSAARGRIHAARGDIDRCRSAFERASELIGDIPVPYYRARIHFGHGQALRRAGKRREADAALASAREIYVSLGATVYVEQCDRELRAGGFNRPRSEDPSKLTAQEWAVTELVASGMTNREAAERLCVSVKTVQYHLTRIYTKCGVRSRSALAAKFAEA
ncbi:helix-turn-helix transcriptional regulator [Nocardiopsis salina]|uniref:helix-turn-helix transcriptional regulator n=1 Tax=Nocardiopsis salina TaxID=245836 RepID=UPI0012689BE9|nr:LuxR C-terminal-related transcriptional regulator [Nocardiopsis salina]